jgi:hypothetical protein
VIGDMADPLETTVKQVADRQLDHDAPGVCENQVCKTRAMRADDYSGMLKQTDLFYPG